MKQKNALLSILALVILTIFFLSKLNSFYAQDKQAQISQQMSAQARTLKTSVTSQLSQLKNTLSSYTGALEESQINWVQLNSFFAFGKVSVTGQGGFSVKSLFSKSGSPADSWDQIYIQKALSLNKYQGLALQAQMFETKDNQNYLVLLFTSDAGTQQDLFYVVGEPYYFQKFFDSSRVIQITQLLTTTDNTVLAHSESQYVGSKTAELKTLKASKKQFEFMDIRSSNMNIVAYENKAFKNKWHVPYFLTALVLGFCLVLSAGILLFFSRNKIIKAEDLFIGDLSDDVKLRELQKKDIFEKSFNQAKASLSFDDVNTKDYPQFNLKPVVPIQDEVVKNENRTTENDAENINNPIESTLSSINPPVVETAIYTPVETTFDQALKNASILISTSLKIHFYGELQSRQIIDEKRIAKAFENIIRNAEEASAKNLNIYFSSSGLGREEIVFTDDGLGIDEKYLVQITEPFFTTKSKQLHRGLGLSEVKSVFEKYNGHMQFSNAADGGMTIKVDFQNSKDTVINKNLHLVDVNTEKENISSDFDELLEIDEDIYLDIDKQLENYSTQFEKEVSKTDFNFKQEKSEIIENPLIRFEHVLKEIDQGEIAIRKPKVAGQSTEDDKK